MTMKFCSNCGAQLEANEKFCPSCGKEISAMNYDTTPFQPDNGLWENLFKTNGRLNRWRYFKRSFGIFILYTFLVIADFLIFMDPTSEYGMGVTGWIAFCVLTILFPIGNVCLTIRRLHDLNFTGWLCLLMTIPAVNTAFWIYTTFAEGTIGPNRYGADPLEGKH